MRKIAYLPLDIPKFDLIHILDNYKFYQHNLWPNKWDCLPVCGKTNKWDADSFYDAYTTRYEEGIVMWNVPEFKEILSYYPGEVTHAQVLNQKEDIIAHKDTPMLLKQREPSGFKILLNPCLEPSFFVKINGKRILVELPDTTNCFAINEYEVLHGSFMPKNPKYIMSCFGILDDTKHEKLVNSSLEKYGDDYAIYF